MELLGSEATEASRRSLRAAIYSCLLVLAGGSYWLSGPASAEDASRDGGEPTDLEEVVSHMPLTYGWGWGWGGGGGGGFGGDASSSLNSWGGGDGVSDIPDTDIAHRAADKGNACPIGNPVIAATGNKIETEVDFVTANGDGLSLKREYNHYWAGTGVFGKHWITNHDYNLVYSDYEPGACTYDAWGLATCDKNRAHTIIAWRPDARRLRYAKAADGRFYSSDVPSGTYMEVDAQGRLVYHAEDNWVEIYGDPTFDIASVISRQSSTGNTWTYDYAMPGFLSRVTYGSGRYIEFLRDPNTFRVMSVRDPAGNFHSYGYRNEANKPVILNSHTQASTGTAVTYHYEDTADSIALTGKSFNGVRYSTFRYDAMRRVSSEEHAGGVDKFSFAYGFEDTTVCDESGCFAPENAPTKTWTGVTSPLGRGTTYNYENGREVGAIGNATPHCPSASVSKSYDANGRLDKSTDARGFVTDFDYDDKGRRVKVTEAVGTTVERIATYIWDDMRDLMLSMTISQGGAAAKRVDYTYTTDNRLASVVETNLKNVGVQGQTRTTMYAYTKHPTGLLASVTVDGPLDGTGDAVKRTFDAAGNLTSEVNGAGHQATYSNHNGLGLPGRITDPNGDVTDYLYDERGRIAEVKSYRSGGTQITRYQYDSFGRLALVTRPDGVKHGYQYDVAGRTLLEYETEPGGTFAQTTYTHNAMSQPVSMKTERVSTEPVVGTLTPSP